MKKRYRNYLSSSANAELIEGKNAVLEKFHSISKTFGALTFTFLGMISMSIATGAKIKNAETPDFNESESYFAQEYVYERNLKEEFDDLAKGTVIVGGALSLASLVAFWMSLKSLKKSQFDFNKAMGDLIEEFLKQPTFVAFIKAYAIDEQKLRENPNYAYDVIGKFVKKTDRAVDRDSRICYEISPGIAEREMLQ